MARSENSPRRPSVKVGILGGTFDPVHAGHVALAQAARRQLKLSRVYMLLSPCSPFKLDKTISDLKDRKKMLGLALKNQKDLHIGTWELNRRGPSYTVDSLAAYKSKFPRRELFLIVGSDILGSFPEWKNPDRILKLATMVVGRRPGGSVQMSGVEGRIIFLKGVFPELSSTRIREMVRSGKRPRGVHAAVAGYIKNHRLYGPYD